MRWKFALLLALPSVAWSLSIVAPKEVLDNGEPISFSWSNGNPPCKLPCIGCWILLQMCVCRHPEDYRRWPGHL